MREAVGGTFLFNIMITFIFFFTSFLAIAINYSQAFRVKNQIINYIEQYEGINNNSDRKRIVDYVNQAGYYREIDCECDGNDYSCGGNINKNNGSNVSTDETKKAKGLCVKKLENDNGDIYYRVTTFVKFNLPIIGDFFTIPVKGETRTIIKPN